jgi:hypothetical protein
VCGAARAGRQLGSVVCKFGSRRLRVSRTVGRCHQEMQCSLTLRSSGAPTACRQAWAMGAHTFSMAQACRHAVGAPLSSNVRQHVHPPRCASISIQMQRVAAIGSIQSVASCFWHSQSSWPRSAHVLRRWRAPSPIRRQPKPWALIPLAVQVSPNSSRGFRVMCALFLAFQRKTASQEIALGLLRPVPWGGGGRAMVGSSQVQFGGSASRVSRTVGRCNQEMQCSLTLRSSGAPTA